MTQAMTTQAMTTQGMTTRGMERSAAATRRSYQRPTLVKRLVLTRITAVKQVVSNALECWVARAAFGEHDLRWMLFRHWLLEDAPVWFRKLYLRHGEAVGGWLAPRPLLRHAVRKMMMPAVRRTLRG